MTTCMLFLITANVSFTSSLVIHYPAFCLASDNDCFRHIHLCSLQSGIETAANYTSMVVIHIFSLPQNLPLYHNQQHNLPAYWLVNVPQSPTARSDKSAILSSVCANNFWQSVVQWSQTPLLHVTCTHQPAQHSTMWHGLAVWQFLRLLYFIASHIIGNPFLKEAHMLKTSLL
jgi:hypothetical protein